MLHPDINNKKQMKDNTYNLIYEIFGYKVTHTTLYKEIGELSNTYKYENILDYLEENKSYLKSAMNKRFVNEYAKIRYFTAILKNSLVDFQRNVPEIKTLFEADIPKSNYKQRKRKKTIAEYEAEAGEEL